MRDEFVLVPRRLTAENGAKAALMGEFHVEQIIGCPDCDEHSGISEDEVCETCGDSGAVVQRLAVPWWTIQKIWLKAIKVVSAPQPVQQPDQLRFSSACEISGPKHPEYVKGYEAAMEVKAREQQPIPTSERLRDALVSLVAVSRRYLPDYDEHPEIQKADAALEHAGSDGFPIDELIASIVCDAIEASRRIRMAFEAGDIAQAIEAQQQGEIKRRYSDKILYAIGMTMPADPEGGAE